MLTSARGEQIEGGRDALPTAGGTPALQEKRRSQSSGIACFATTLERKGRLDLNQTRRGIAPQERSKDGSRSAHGGDDRTEARIGNVSDRLIKVWMVEQ